MESRLRCPYCSLTYNDRQSLQRHIRNKHKDQVKIPITNDENGMYQCGLCSKKFLNVEAFRRHALNHSKDVFTCDRCFARFRTSEGRNKHMDQCQFQRGSGSNQVEENGSMLDENRDFVLTDNALNHNAEVYSYKFSKTATDQTLKQVLLKLAAEFLQKYTLQKKQNLKISFALKVSFYKASDTSVSTDPPIMFHSETFSLYIGDSIDSLTQYLNMCLMNFLLSLEEFATNGSGWVLDLYLSLDIIIALNDVIRSGSYIKLPKELNNAKKGLINLQNKDQKCFLWSILAWKFPVDTHPERISHYEEKESQISMKGMLIDIILLKFILHI